MQYDAWFCEWGAPMTAKSYEKFVRSDRMAAYDMGEDEGTADRVRPGFDDVVTTQRGDLAELARQLEPHGAGLPEEPCDRGQFFPQVGSLYSVETVFRLAVAMLDPQPDVVGIAHVLFLPVEFPGRLWIEGERRSWSHGSGALCEVNRFRYRPLVLAPLLSTVSLQTGLMRLAQYHEVVAEVMELQDLYAAEMRAMNDASFTVSLADEEPATRREDDDEAWDLFDAARQRLRDAAHARQRAAPPFSLVTAARLLFVCREALRYGSGFRVDRP
jgi:hypothetical protein